ncbi:hypothetical protein B0H17DRAFT_920470 [Mycena rosella]|uniref:CUE domain-containing protein n=1 Tax=Mycena rosella TaxID=1033263 RepID=A0AAD7GU83_MYCRO|nr:hypothetical protein B0H17DRAFT_920470 [Mycena rosella]
MGETINIVVAFAVIVFLFRWLTSSTAADTLGFRPKPVSQDMIDTISNMFPDIPPDNIRYDLLRTGSVELSSNKILERGFLDPPPQAYFTLYPRDANAEPGGRPAPAGAATSSAVKAKQSLIDRYNLQERVVQPGPLISEEEIGGKAVWEDSSEKREASLKERKAQMILAARQYMVFPLLSRHSSLMRSSQADVGPAAESCPVMIYDALFYHGCNVTRVFPNYRSTSSFGLGGSCSRTV